MNNNVYDISDYRLGPTGDLPVSRSANSQVKAPEILHEVLLYPGQVARGTTVRQLYEILPPEGWQFSLDHVGGDQFRNGFAVRHLNFAGGPWIAYLDVEKRRLQSVTLHYDPDGSAGIEEVWPRFTAAWEFFTGRYDNWFQRLPDPATPILSHGCIFEGVQIWLTLDLISHELVCEMTKIQASGA